MCFTMFEGETFPSAFSFLHPLVYSDSLCNGKLKMSFCCTHRNVVQQCFAESPEQTLLIRFPTMLEPTMLENNFYRF